MRFFTDKTVENPYLLIKIKDYLKVRDNEVKKDAFYYFKQWKEVFIDPGVYELTKSKEYSWVNDIDISKFLDSLPENHYFSFDYPSDVNLKYTNYFLERSWDNAVMYNCHPQYITTVQSPFNNYWGFTEWFDKYNELYSREGSQIMGLGNICRIHYLNDFVKHSLDYAFKHCKYPRIHVYGLGLRNIKYAYRLARHFDIELSMDSTKWTRCPHTSGRASCNSSNRQEYFNDYIQYIKKRGIEINE